jgi:hypothetical protein
MTRSRFYATVLPSAAIIYVIVLVAVGFDGTSAAIGGLVIGLIAVLGLALPAGARGEPGELARTRDRRRYRSASDR